MKLSKTQLAVLSLIIANIIWGAAPPIFKWSFSEIQPFTLAFIRFLIASAILYPFVRNKLKIHKEDWLILMFISVIGLTFHIAYYYVGLQLSSSINVPIISSAAPLFIIIGSTLFLHEKLKKKVMQGALISLIGVLIIVMRPLIEGGINNSLIGNLMFIVSMGLSVFYTLLLKEIAPKYNPLTLTFWIFLLTAISFSPFILFESVNSSFLFNFDTKSIIGILFGALLSSTVAYSLQTFAIKYIAANEVAVFSYVDPIVAIIIAKPLLGETITTTFITGAALIFFGIFVSEGRFHYHPIHLLKPKLSPTSFNQDLKNPDEHKTELHELKS